MCQEHVLSTVLMTLSIDNLSDFPLNSHYHYEILKHFHDCDYTSKYCIIKPVTHLKIIIVLKRHSTFSLSDHVLYMTNRQTKM